MLLAFLSFDVNNYPRRPVAPRLQAFLKQCPPHSPPCSACVGSPPGNCCSNAPPIPSIKRSYCTPLSCGCFQPCCSMESPLSAGSGPCSRDLFTHLSVDGVGLRNCAAGAVPWGNGPTYLLARVTMIVAESASYSQLKRIFAAIFCGLIVVSGLLIGGATPCFHQMNILIWFGGTP